ncbi:MAG: hypothetical protein ACRBN8_02080 [Nannocystales bacterium]
MKSNAKRTPLLSVFVAAMQACTVEGVSNDDDTPFASGVDPVASTSASTSADGHAGASETTRGSETGSGSSSGAPVEDGPTVDVLFVIDNSVEDDISDFQLSDAHQRLIDAAPPFLEALRAEPLRASLHVGVSTGDAYGFNESSGTGCETLPGLVRSTAFGDCGPFDSGFNYMTDGDDLEAVFGCVGRVGVFGDAVPRVAETALQVVEGELSEAGACNEGFLRDDAVLVLVLLADGDEDPATGSPQSWSDRIQSARGSADRVFVVTLVDPPGLECDGNALANEDGARFWLFASGFGDHAVRAPICVEDYAPYFEAAAERIVEVVGG